MGENQAGTAREAREHREATNSDLVHRVRRLYLRLLLRRPQSRVTASRVRREKAALSSGCKPHPATAPAGSNRSSHGGDEMAEAFGVAGHI